MEYQYEIERLPIDYEALYEVHNIELKTKEIVDHEQIYNFIKHYKFNEELIKRATLKLNQFEKIYIDTENKKVFMKQHEPYTPKPNIKVSEVSEEFTRDGYDDNLRQQVEEMYDQLR